MTDPQHKPGDIVNGHRLTAQPDGSLTWLPVSAAPEHKPGDIANGHRLTQQPDGSLVWVSLGEELKPKKSRRPLWITLGSVAGVLLLIIIIGSINRPASTSPAADKGLEIVQVEPEEPAEPAEPEKLTVPDVTGMAASTAVSQLRGAGFEVADPADAGAIVTGTMPAKGGIAEQGSTVTLTVEPPKPKLTLGQENAVSKGKAYLAMTGFSRSGLIQQLEFEGYSTEDATFAADHLAPDWNAEAAEKAQSYLDMTGFSREGLYDQLVFEGFTDAEANAGLAAVGY